MGRKFIGDPYWFDEYLGEDYGPYQPIKELVEELDTNKATHWSLANLAGILNWFEDGVCKRLLSCN